MTPPLRYLQSNGPAYGWLLASTTLVSCILIGHHPIPVIPIADGHDPARGLQNIVALGGPERWMHSAMILIVLLLTTGFSGFAWRLGVAHPLVMAGWLSQVLGAAAMIGAALIDGFVIPDVASRGIAEGGNPAGIYDLIALCGAWLQADTKLGFVLMALSAVFFGHALLHHKGGALWIGLLGIGVGGFSAIYVLTLTARFNPPLLLAYMTAQAAWHLTVAFWMIRRLKRPE